MKHKNWLPQITAGSVTFMLAVCSVGCLVTGFELNADFGKIMLYLGLFTALCTLSFLLRHGGLIPLGLLALSLGYLWRKGEIILQFQSLLLNITSRYHSAYGIGRLFPGAAYGTVGPMDLPLTVLGCLMVLVVCWAVMRRKSAAYVPLATLPLLIACLVVTDTAPGSLALYGLLLGNLGLMITDWVRGQGRDGENRLLAVMLLCVAAALGILFLANPKDSYVNRAGEIQGRLFSLAERIQDLVEDFGEETVIGGGEITGAEQVNLRILGPRSQWGYSVMEVTSPVSGVVYLRGQDYNTYNGTGWISSRHRSEVFSADSDPVGEMKIKTYGVKPVLYVPYYPGQELTMVSGCLDNREEVSEYSFSYCPDVSEGIPGISSDMFAPDAYSQSLPYRQLPPDTMLWAKEMVAPLLEGVYPLSSKVEAIRDFVSNSAVYDLKTGRMSRDYDDFAQWFLEESDKGYCVHFATAATVLLRAAGIQARYVEGYAIYCEAGEETVVTGRSAHAWAEYYDASADAWRILEATPAEVEDTGIVPPTEGREEIRETQTAETRPAPATEPEETAPEKAPEKPDTQTDKPFKLPGWVKNMAWLSVAAAAVWAQSVLRIRWKRELWNKGRANRKALNRWKQVQQLGRIVRLEVPEELESLAQKAKYSQHTITAPELRHFDAFRLQCMERLAERGKAAQIAAKILFAIG